MKLILAYLMTHVHDAHARLVLAQTYARISKERKISIFDFRGLVTARMEEILNDTLIPEFTEDEASEDTIRVDFETDFKH